VKKINAIIQEQGNVITLQKRYAGMPFLLVFADRVDGSIPTASVVKVLKSIFSRLFLL
jgi:hypothetical protein